MQSNYEKQLRHLKHIQAHVMEGRFLNFTHQPVVIFFLCLAWLMIRSGRKPSRLSYPCQQVAAITVTTYLGIIFIILNRRIIAFFREKIWSRLTVGNSVVILVIAAFLVGGIPPYLVYRSFREYDLTKPSKPVGIPIDKRDAKKGLLYQTIPSAMLLDSPHRVVSVHSSNATTWTGTGNAHNYINQEEVNRMVREGILRLTGETDYIEAWRQLIPYQTDEIVGIKYNGNNHPSLSSEDMNPYVELINAVLDGLIGMGVPADRIWLVDPSRGTSADWRTKVKYQNVIFAPRRGGYVSIDSPYCNTADFVIEGPTPVRPGVVYTEINHLINMPQLKGHGGASVTLSLKNHYGSAEIGTQGRGYWHEYIYQNRPNYGKNGINPLLAINLNPLFVQKTRLIIGDGLYGHPTSNGSPPVLFRSFGNSPPEILFFGVDPVATDSVMFDYLQRECRVSGRQARKDDLHIDAADAGLGVTEHWDSDNTRNYGAIDYVEVDFDGGTPPPVRYGDVNGDNEITAYDASLAAHIAVGMNHQHIVNRAAADVNGDNGVTAYDAALIAQYAVGIIDRFPRGG